MTTETKQVAHTCGQPERDRQILRKFAERYAVMALVNFPEKYEDRKRVLTNAIVAALVDPKAAL